MMLCQCIPCAPRISVATMTTRRSQRAIDVDVRALRQAIVNYDAAESHIRYIVMTADSERAITRALAFERLLMNRVREELFLATSNVNSRSQAYLVHPWEAWMRRFVGMPPYAI